MAAEGKKDKGQQNRDQGGQMRDHPRQFRERSPPPAGGRDNYNEFSGRGRDLPPPGGRELPPPPRDLYALDMQDPYRRALPPDPYFERYRDDPYRYDMTDAIICFLSSCVFLYLDVSSKNSNVAMTLMYYDIYKLIMMSMCYRCKL